MKNISTVHIRDAVISDARDVAPLLRQADIRDIKAKSDRTVLQVLKNGIKNSDPVYAIVNSNNKPFALFGVVPDEYDKCKGLVWHVGTDDIARYSRFYLRNTRKWIDRLHSRYRVLWNCADPANEAQVRWMLWCGFTVHRRIECYGVCQKPYLELWKVSDQNNLSTREFPE